MSLTFDRSKGSARWVMDTRRRHSFGHNAVGFVVAAVDLLILITASGFAAFTYGHLTIGFMWEPEKSLGVGLWTGVTFILAMSCLQGYRYEDLRSIRRQAVLIVVLVPSVLALLLTVIFFLKLGNQFSRGETLYFAILSIASLTGARLVWRRPLWAALANGWVRPKNTFVICSEKMSTDRLKQFTETTSLRVLQVGWVSHEPDSFARLHQQLYELSGRGAADEIIIVWQEESRDRLEELLLLLRRLPLPVKVVLDNFTSSIVSCRSEALGPVPAFQVQSEPLGVLERFLKRSFDVAFAVVALVSLAPIMLLVAIAIKLESPGPVFFRQRRRGHANRQFQIIKFRSMSVMEDGADIRQATRCDPRITRVGAYIRAFSIDELPQFINVICGDMSVVGPRPHAVAHDDVYDRMIIEYAARRHVKPGVTGWAQVNGYRGETPDIATMEQRVGHDLWYIDNWSVWLDFKIVLRTTLALRGH